MALYSPRQLHVDCLQSGAHVSCNQDIPSCPSLTQLSLKHLKNGDDVLSALRKAIQRGHLPSLNYLGFYYCSFKTEGILLYLFGSRTPALEDLGLGGLKLNRSDLQFISELSTLRVLSLSTGPCLQAETVQHPFQNPDANVGVTRIYSEFLEGFVRVVNENKLPNLERLMLSGDESKDKTYSDLYTDISVLKFQAEKLPSLKRLYLAGFIFSGEDVQDLAQRLVKWDLEELRIFHGRGISGHLSVLFRHCFTSLRHPELSSCELTSDDMCCLTEAREQGVLPKLKGLHVSGNRIKNPEMWVENEAWKNVEIDHHGQKVPRPSTTIPISLAPQFGFGHVLRFAGFKNSGLVHIQMCFCN